MSITKKLQNQDVIDFLNEHQKKKTGWTRLALMLEDRFKVTVNPDSLITYISILRKKGFEIEYRKTGPKGGRQ